MAEERLTLIDDMSPALRRIAQEAERAYASLNKLKNTSKSIMVPGSISRAISDIQRLEKQFQKTQQSISARARQIVQAGHPSVSFSKTGGYLVNGEAVHPANVPILEQRLAQNWQRAQQISAWRRSQTFDERLAKTGFAQRYAARQALLANSRELPNNMNKLSGAFSKLGIDSRSLNYRFLNLIAVLGSFEYVIHAVGDLFHQMIEPQEKYVGALSRVALTSDRTRTPREMMSRIYDTAIRTRADAQGTMMLYNRIAMSGAKLTNDRILRFVETFNKTMMISGTSAQENRAVMLQLAQGIGSNRLGGDEFRSIAEQAPMFKYFLARGLGVNPGALKEMGAKGQLTAEAIISALEKEQDIIDDIATEAPWTLGQAFTILKNQWEQAVTSQLDGYLALTQVFKDLSNWMTTVEGKDFVNRVVFALNRALLFTADALRSMAGPIKWIIDNLDIVSRWVKGFLGFVLLTNLIGALGRLFMWIVNVRGAFLALLPVIASVQAQGILAFESIAGAIGVSTSALTGFLATAGQVLAGLVAIVGAAYALKHINDELDPNKIAQDRQQKNARFVYEQDIDKWITSQIGVKPTFMTAAGSSTKLSASEQKMVDDWNSQYSQYARMKDVAMAQWDTDAKKGVFRRFRGAQDMDPTAAFLSNLMPKSFGVMDSSKNKPMDVNNVKNVDHINDDINLSTESIQMMKAIAERQWVVQNEITVPQNVNMNVDKSTNVDPESLSQALNQGMQIAIASSMRGEAFV